MPRTQQAPVLALLIRSAAGPWAASALTAVRAGSVVPQRVLVVDTAPQSAGTEDLDDFDDLADLADRASGTAADDADVPVGVLAAEPDADRATIVSEVLTRVAAEWGDSPESEESAESDGGEARAEFADWVWVLSDVDGLVPESECLAELLTAAEAEPDVGILLPRAVGAAPDETVPADTSPGEDTYPAEAPGALIRVTWESDHESDPGVDTDTGVDTDSDTDTDTDSHTATDTDVQDETAVSVPAARLAALAEGGRSSTAAPAPADAGSAESRDDRSRPARHARQRTRAPWWRVLSSPPVVLGAVLAAVSLIVHGLLADRLGLDLAGGALLPVGGLSEVWSAYLASWHGVAGGTTSAASPAMAVLGVLGVAGGPEVAVSLLLLLDLPLAGLVAYGATRRLGVGRWVRAGGAAAYALIPAATDAVAAGRVDVVVVHIVAPAVAAGLISLLTRPEVRWLPLSALCALGLALLGAFSPITYGTAVAGLLVAFVALPAPTGRTGRGIPALVGVVLLPPALAMPWLPTLVAHPVLLLHGITGPSTEAGVAGLLGLHPAGGVPLGIVVVLAAVVACVLAPGRHLAAGLALTALGVAGVVVTQLVRATPLTGGAAAPGYAGAPLIVVGMGLVALVLTAFRAPAGRGSARSAGRASAAVAGGALTLVALVLAAGFASAAEQPRGEVRAGGGVRLAPALDTELADSGRGVLVLGHGAQPDRLAAARTPRFGDDALAPVGGMAQRLEGWRYGLLAGSRDAVTDAAAAGVQFVVLPPGEDGGALRGEAGDLVRSAPNTSDGRTVLRLTPESGQVTLVSPEQAHRAVSGGAPSDELMRGSAIARVDARLPEAHVRVSDGPEGRLLVLAAEHEPGWTATVDGEPVPITPAWGHQVAVSVPEQSSEVVVQYSSPAHGVFLLGSVAALLFTVLTAIPGRGRPHGTRGR